MPNYAYALNNIFGITLLFLLLISFHRKGQRLYLSAETIFKAMLLANILILIADYFTWLLDGTVFPGASTLNLIATVFLYAFNPLVGYLYLLYCDKKMRLSARFFQVHSIIFGVVLLLNFVLSVAGCFRPVLFELDSANVYHRGPLFWLSMALSYAPVAYAFFQVAVVQYLRRRNPDQRVYSPLMLFPLPGIIGGILQIFLPECSIVWVASVFSMLILFLWLQNAQIGNDPLTGLANRERLISFFYWKLRHIAPDMQLYCVMLDLDCFKAINDRFGHQVGNEALITIANAMTVNCQKDDFICRYGGDEFILLVQRRQEREIAEIMEKVQLTANHLVVQQQASYELGFSYGFAADNGSNNPEEIISRADKKMYRSKAKRKRQLNEGIE